MRILKKRGMLWTLKEGRDAYETSGDERVGGIVIDSRCLGNPEILRGYIEYAVPATCISTVAHRAEHGDAQIYVGRLLGSHRVALFEQGCDVGCKRFFFGIMGDGNHLGNARVAGNGLQRSAVWGDVSGIEEASSAMIEGRIAGIAAAHYLGFIDDEELKLKTAQQEAALEGLRQGMFAPKNRGKLVEKTEEGIDVSMNLLKKGYIADDEIERYPGVTHTVGIHPVMECTQNIPCNPCQDACAKGCISIGANITSLPVVKNDVKLVIYAC